MFFPIRCCDLMFLVRLYSFLHKALIPQFLFFYSGVGVIRSFVPFPPIFPLGLVLDTGVSDFLSSFPFTLTFLETGLGFLIPSSLFPFLICVI